MNAQNPQNRNSRSSGTTLSLALAVMLSLVVHALMLPNAAQAQCDPEEIAKLLARRGNGTAFGFSVAISGETAIGGAPSDTNINVQCGAAYAFRYVGSQWADKTKLVPLDGEDFDGFGISVSASESAVVVGADGEDGQRSSNAGAAYVFRYDESEWVQEAKLVSPSEQGNAYFGRSVAVFGDVAIVGAPGYDSGGSDDGGAAFVYRFDGQEWVMEATLLSSDPHRNYMDQFGSSVAITDNIAVVGAWGVDYPQPDTGAAYVFRFDGSGWKQESKLANPRMAIFDHFGKSTAVHGDTVLVGSPWADDLGTHSGSAYIFRFDGSAWAEEAQLLASDGSAEDHFGESVAIYGDTALIGAGDYWYEHGAAYVFRRSGQQWIEQSRLEPQIGRANDYFGSSVALSGNTALIGAYGDEEMGSDAGAGDIFELNCAEPSCLSLDVQNLVAGQRAQFTISGGTPGTQAVTAYGLQLGETIINGIGGYCANFDINGVKQSRIIGGLDRTFDSNSEIAFEVFVPGAAQGRTVYFQSAMQNTCPDQCMSNLIEAVVQ